MLKTLIFIGSLGLTTAAASAQPSDPQTVTYEAVTANSPTGISRLRVTKVDDNAYAIDFSIVALNRTQHTGHIQGLATKKGIGLLCPRAQVSYRLIDELQTKAVPVAQTCRLLGVSRAGFYEAKRRAAKPAFCKASVNLRAVFMSSGQSYGSRRLVTALANSGFQVGRYKVRRLMQQASLKPVWKRKFVHTTDSKHALPIAPNVLARQFNPAAPNLAYASDITYIRTGAGWLYLAVVLDLFSRRVVGWAMAPSMPASLVCDALRMAIQARRPIAGLVVHSDRGSQYASEQYQALLSEHGFVCSMSRKGNCWDNAVAERFFLNLKMERVWQRNYANHAEAKLDVANYIAGFYNCERLHSVLGNLPPSVYERTMAAKELIVVSENT